MLRLFPHCESGIPGFETRTGLPPLLLLSQKSNALCAPTRPYFMMTTAVM